MPTYRLRIESPRPFFAEVPYYVWGEVNYDSEGDCASPTDREWKWLELTHRDTGERLEIGSADEVWEVEGPDPVAARVARFLMARCGAVPIDGDPLEDLGDWDHAAAMGRAEAVRQTFERPELRPFDCGHRFWGSWKWIGWFATEFTWVGRWIMHSVLTNDARAVNLCVEWLRHGTWDEAQSEALRYALARLTGKSFRTDRECIRWYDRGGKAGYPEPDFDRWLADLQGQTGTA